MYVSLGTHVCHRVFSAYKRKQFIPDAFVYKSIKIFSVAQYR